MGEEEHQARRRKSGKTSLIRDTSWRIIDAMRGISERPKLSGSCGGLLNVCMAAISVKETEIARW